MQMTTETKAKRKAKKAHIVRCADGNYLEINNYGRKLAMAAFCTECMGFMGGAQDCSAIFCPLYPFRANTLRTKTGNLDKNGNEIKAKQ